ncbi:hypothetical protein A2960_05555 [Candidatus Gottesmanbacteria bacterium RIFCSPLOWO2_01_FULL_39_12b]|uniref:N-acetyltransferase domain-containing protein n=1 Tax=Candidatus Gottesmanbacteria bacterium RIFCSPLOWO2_01_FULL_39_12b TaxID=1798388 RepID=A0A1F6ANR5_9BACT|nr:MAG: hypothetical protein A2960_05555 [Candidatus Gottesmanbacteria bacterium RIFCSPLOWO2_01_FULL_39_12b]
MILREFGKSDQPKVKEFILGVLREFGFDHNLDLDFNLENPDKYYKNVGGIFYLLENNGEIIGTIAVKNIGNKKAEIKRLYINKDYRGQGLGLKLFDRALQFSKDSGFQSAKLDTWVRFKTAFSLYKKRGFKITKTVGEQIYMERKLR